MKSDRTRVVRDALRAWAARQRELAAEVERALAPLVKAAREAERREAREEARCRKA
jgi:hypothetical protein